MSKGFFEILEIARENIRSNPSLQGRTAEDVALQYLEWLQDEVAEVTEEVKEHNRIHLEDELSDIAWNYAVILALLEERGLIDSVETVLEHGLNKYKERRPAFLAADQSLWNEVKAKQKTELMQRHEELYGN
jgi:NTP pyrophosphatase (non-canonical NTP hydrolase)